MFIEPFALLRRALTIPRMRLCVCCLRRCWSIHWVTQTLPDTLSSQPLWLTSTCSTVSLFNTVCAGETQISYSCLPAFVSEKQLKCSQLNYLHGLMILGAYQRDRVNLLCWERKHQPAQMFNIPNLPFGWLPGKQVHISHHYCCLCNPRLTASTMLEFLPLNVF